MWLRAIPYFLEALTIVVQAHTPQLKLGHTTLIGRNITELGLEFFGGIPFAKPPLGESRLRPPVLKTRLRAKTFNATDFGKGCLQPGNSVAGFSEDCLTINILRPAGLKPDAKLPILFWTYGGGFQGGALSTYNGSAIVAQSVARGTPVIYVNYNYRLGPLGFPQGQEADDHGALNLALKDQLAALEWVQANIGTFGGDKSKVTVFGESAGAIMTSLLFLNSPLDRLARAAMSFFALRNREQTSWLGFKRSNIFESGAAATPQEFPASRREIDWQNFVAGVPSCASLSLTKNTFGCLTAANSTEILSGIINGIAKAPELFAYNPTFDGPHGLFPDISSRLLNAGHFAKLPFIAGTNLDEGTVFTNMSIQTTQDIQDHLFQIYSPPLVSQTEFANTISTLLDLYPDDPSLGSPYNTGNETFGLNSNFKRGAAINGDLLFDGQRRTWAQTASRVGVKTYGYLFTQPQSIGFPAFGVLHGSEVPFVYGVPSNPSFSDLRLSAIMIDYWVSFATSLDPNDGKGLPRPHWAQYTPNNEAVLQLNGANMTMIPDTYRQEQMAFIKSHSVAFHQRRSAN